MKNLEEKIDDKINNNEWRKNPTTNEWVIISEKRIERPIQTDETINSVTSIKGNSYCPFCPGNERNTPPENYAYPNNNREPNTPGWEVRNVPNMFPALMTEGEFNFRKHDIFETMTGIGAHEVTIMSPDKNHPKIEELPADQIYKSLFVIRERMKILEQNKKLVYSLFFINQGKAARASLEHPHSQIVAMPLIVPRVRNELYITSSYFNREFGQSCIYCDIIEHNLKIKERLIYQNDKFISFTEFAPRYAYESVILPFKHNSDFKKSTDEDIKSLADILKKVLSKIGNLNGFSSDYNVGLHTSPTEIGKIKHPKLDTDISYHYHLEITPRGLNEIAGFEIATETPIVPIRPERAAEYLRYL